MTEKIHARSAEKACLCFAMADYSLGLAQEFGLPRLSDPRPVVTAVNPDGPAAKAGIAPGGTRANAKFLTMSHGSSSGDIA